MNVIIIGCGKTGSRLANALDERGYDVAVVDSDNSNFLLLSEDFSGLAVCGEVTDIDVLRNAGCENADIAAVVTSSDNINVMVAQTLDAEFGLKNVFVRILDPSREAVFRKFGLHTICPTRLESDILFDLITEDSDEIDSIHIGGNSVHFAAEKAERKMIDMAVSDIATKPNEMIFAVRRKSGQLIMSDREGLTIEDGDQIIYAIM